MNVFKYEQQILQKTAIQILQKVTTADPINTVELKKRKYLMKMREYM